MQLQTCTLYVRLAHVYERCLRTMKRSGSKEMLTTWDPGGEGSRWACQSEELLLIIPPPEDITRVGELLLYTALILSESHPICNAHDQ